MTILERILHEKIVAIIRGFDKDKTLKAAEALNNGGIKFLEIPFDQTKPESYTAEKIYAVNEMYSSHDVFIGAGTVLTPEQVELAHKAGARYIITPATDRDVIKKAKDLGMLAMPGAMTPTEIVQCWKCGADIVKIFPSDVLGIKFIRALRGPLGHIPLFAVGGVNLDNLHEFFKAGVKGIGVGGNIVNSEMINADNYAGITSLASEYVKKIQETCI